MEIYEHVSEELGTSAAWVAEFLTDPADAGDPDLLATAKCACNQYIATLLLLCSDPRCYRGLDLTIQHTRGIDRYPDSATRASEMLVSYWAPHQQHCPHAHDGWISFAQDHDDYTDKSKNHAIHQGDGEGG